MIIWASPPHPSKDYKLSRQNCDPKNKDKPPNIQVRDRKLRSLNWQFSLASQDKEVTLSWDLCVYYKW